MQANTCNQQATSTCTLAWCWCGLAVSQSLVGPVLYRKTVNLSTRNCLLGGPSCPCGGHQYNVRVQKKTHASTGTRHRCPLTHHTKDSFGKTKRYPATSAVTLPGTGPAPNWAVLCHKPEALKVIEAPHRQAGRQAGRYTRKCRISKLSMHGTHTSLSTTQQHCLGQGQCWLGACDAKVHGMNMALQQRGQRACASTRITPAAHCR